MFQRRRERDPICDVCGHNHVQGVKCQICGHVGKYIVPGGPNRPNRGAIPPVPPGPIHAPNMTPPTIEGLSVATFQAALQGFFELLPQVGFALQSLCVHSHTAQTHRSDLSPEDMRLGED